MIFTIGDVDIYTPTAIQNGLFKLGKTDIETSTEFPDGVYPGGSVFLTLEEANAAIGENQAVYLVEGDWESDVYELNGNFHLKDNKKVLCQIL